MINIAYTSIDHCRASRSFKTLAAARRFAHKMVGAHPEIGSHYAVSGDGIGKVTVRGATLADLFPTGDASERLNAREMEIALYGDGRHTTYWGQDGDPRNGERLFNTKEDDAALEQALAEERSARTAEFAAIGDEWLF